MTNLDTCLNVDELLIDMVKKKKNTEEEYYTEKDFDGLKIFIKQ
jgi:hypothetical protein